MLHSILICLQDQHGSLEVLRLFLLDAEAEKSWDLEFKPIVHLERKPHFHFSPVDSVIVQTVIKENNGLISSFNGVAEYQPGRHSTAPAFSCHGSGEYTEHTEKKSFFVISVFP